MANQTKGLEQRLQQLAKNWVEPYLKPLDFKKRSFTYTKPLDDLWWLLNFQRSRWNDRNHNAFTVNLGVYVRGIAELLRGSEPSNPTIPDCAFHLRLGELAYGQDKWWEIRTDDLNPADVDEAIGKEIHALLEQYALPFLNRFRAKQDVLKYLLEISSHTKRRVSWPTSKFWALVYAAMLYQLMGDREECCRMLIAACEEARRNRLLEDVAQNLHARFCQDLKQT